jgi:hypothetical protein
MTNKHSIAAALAGWAQVARGWAEGRLHQRDRGDVPGWVLITIMTAGLVTVLWALAGTQLKELFTQAMSSVTGPR